MSQQSTPVWNVDQSHTEVGFSIRHLMIATVRGRFGQFNGTITGDLSDFSQAQIEAEIDASSIDTNDAERDEHLRSGDFFEVDKFPKISFRSNEIVPAGDNRYTVRGDLTIRGVTKPVELDTTFGGTATDPWGNSKAAFNAQAKLNRKDFGLTWNSVLETGGVLVGDEVDLNLNVELTQQAEE